MGLLSLFGIGKKEKVVQNTVAHIHICSFQNQTNMRIAQELKKYFPHTTASVGFSSLAHISPSPDVIILYQAVERTVCTRDEIQKYVASIHEHHPNTKIIWCDIQHMAGECISAGVDAYQSIEAHYFGQGSNYVITNLGRDKADVNGWTGFGCFDVKLAREQIQMLLVHATQDSAQLEVEKRAFYNGVKNIFIIRSLETAKSAEELKFILSIIVQHKPRKVLDVGCGLGRITIPLAKVAPKYNFTIEGIDISDELLNVAIENARTENVSLKFTRQNALQTQYRFQELDCVILMWHTICDLKEHRVQLFGEMCRILKPGGILIFDFPDIDKNKHISKNGRYENQTPFGTYVSIVPELKDIFTELSSKGLLDIRYERVNWGIPKYVVVARSYGLTW
jgi:ubiquinone/menaquinone biosynthesis C-methylase UbiE